MGVFPSLGSSVNDFDFLFCAFSAVTHYQFSLCHLLFVMKTPKCRSVSVCKLWCWTAEWSWTGLFGRHKETAKSMCYLSICLSMKRLMILPLHLPFDFIVNSTVRYVEQITSFRADIPRCPEPWEVAVILKYIHLAVRDFCTLEICKLDYFKLISWRLK